ncbi:MAG: SusC/RagA family TonB-linked outer membrane protein [Cyclobacteriaceae bacterium]
MKIKLLQQIITMSKYILYGVFLQAFVMSMLWAKESKAQKESIYDIQLSIQWDNVSISEALADVEEKTDFRFTFNNGEFDKNKSVKLKAENKSLGQILLSLSKKSNLKFQRINENIHVSKRTGTERAISENLFVDVQVSGKVVDENGEGLPGVSVVVKGTTTGTTTNLDGEYKINVAENAVLSFSFVGYIRQDIGVSTRSVIDVSMQPDAKQLEEIVVVGFGTQKKEAVVGAMSSVSPQELKIPSSNLTTALAGRISGVVSYQTSGEPGADNAQFFVRGVASFNGQNGPLILIDGVELTANDLARLQPDDIESFSVLKDPTTTAIYGARGANGIILVTTKTGVDGPAVVNVRLENSISAPVKIIDLADPITHMRMQNEAQRTRGNFSEFTEQKIKGTERGLSENAFPATDWYDALLKDYTSTQRINLNVRGGGKNVRYYVAGSLNKDNGLLEVNNTNNFTNNISLKQYLLRSNINIDLHKNTEMIVRLHSTIDDYRGPLASGNAIYNAAVRTSPVRFRPVFDPDDDLVGVPHILFGNDLGSRLGLTGDDGAVWFNPYAELQRGYKDRRRQLSLVQVEFKQKLDAITPGLSARFLGNSNTTSQFENRRAYQPFFYRVEPSSFDPLTGDYDLVRSAEGNESLELEPSLRTNNSVLYMEAALNYYRTFAEKHSVSGLLVMIAREYLDGNANTVQLSLPSRNVGISGRFNYELNSKYFAEFNFGYNGSERFSKQSRFGFFPSFGLGWLISEEPFFSGLSSTINRLKLRASFGWVGNDNIGNTRNDRFFYLSEVNLSGGGGSVFGTRFDTNISGVSISRYANPLVTWEKARKSNLGLEANFLDDNLQFRVDAFHELRTDILQTRADIPSTLGLQAEVQSNVGEVTAYGIDASLDMNHYFSNDFWVSARGTFTYADNEYKVFEEPNYSAQGAPWVSNIGNNVSVTRGLIAERLFVDDAEARNSPLQFGVPNDENGIGNYGGGDIKYKDLNGDGIISDLDQTAIGNPRVPKITYGLGVSAGYKKVDFSIFFQGLGQTSFFIDPVRTGPFINSLAGTQTRDDDELLRSAAFGGNGFLTENAVLQAYADSYWSEENRDVYALWPRLSIDPIENNNQTSTWWLRDGSFLRLKQLEIGYTAVDGGNNKLGIEKVRVYLSGTNLMQWSKFKLWDPELGGSGLNYPLQRVFNLGVHVGF